MTVAESLLIALFCIAVVFAVLLGLYALIRLFSLVIVGLSEKKEASGYK